MNKFLDVISETVNGYNAINEEFIIAKDILKVLNNK
jgi:hypothetical protein